MGFIVICSFHLGPATQFNMNLKLFLKPEIKIGSLDTEKGKQFYSNQSLGISKLRNIIDDNQRSLEDKEHNPTR